MKGGELMAPRLSLIPHKDINLCVDFTVYESTKPEGAVCVTKVLV